jgi:hypothetical protein
MKKAIWIVAGVVVLSLLVVQLTKRMAHGAEGVAHSDEQVEQADSLATKNTKKTDLSAGGAGARLEGAQSANPVAVAAKPQWTPEELSDPVKTLLGLDGKERNYLLLMQAIARLGNDLSAADVAALRELLTFSNDRFPAKMRPIEINAVKNDVLSRLLRQTQLSEGLGIQMAEMAANPSNDPVWRDYCVQFMQPFYERCSGELATKNTKGHQEESSVSSSAAGGEKTSVEVSAIHDAMFAALDERSTTIAGTALVGLELLSRTHEEFDRELIVAKTVEIASDESASSSSRLTALRLSASGNLKPETGNLNEEVVNTARTLAQTGETVLLRSAAIVTLGEVGTVDDRELLDTFALSDNKQIAAAAKLALQKMDSRN